MAKSKVQTHKRMDNNCHIPDLVQAFFYVENGALIHTISIKSNRKTRMAYFLQLNNHYEKHMRNTRENTWSFAINVSL